MQIYLEKPLDNQPGNQSLDTADAVARAAHIWIRSLCLTDLQDEDEKHSVACGLITGLCERLDLDPRVRELVAYVYALLDDDGTKSLATSRVMLHEAASPTNLPAYKKGLSEAAAIVEMLAFHTRKN